ncbi:MarR family transcriptional regulator [Salinicola halophilus]|uniref:MarR family transcriptional regulator n=1 Tax=Salinicola halophilus TaxID=184065 RepID=UPI000DA168EB|nr:helix-turn-helix domain-containing protein [Salinicola halophilus]
MPETGDDADLAQALAALLQAHLGLDPLAGVVWLALRDVGDSPRGLTTAQLSRRLEVEHALVRRAAAELEALGWIDSRPAGGASPALRLTMVEVPGDGSGDA